MNLEDVAERVGKSKRTVMRWVDQGRFPAPVIRSGRLIVWLGSVVERWVRRHRGTIEAHNGEVRRRRNLSRKRLGADQDADG